MADLDNKYMQNTIFGRVRMHGFKQRASTLRLVLMVLSSFAAGMLYAGVARADSPIGILHSARIGVGTAVEATVGDFNPFSPGLEYALHSKDGTGAFVFNSSGEYISFINRNPDKTLSSNGSDYGNPAVFRFVADIDGDGAKEGAFCYTDGTIEFMNYLDEVVATFDTGSDNPINTPVASTIIDDKNYFAVDGGFGVGTFVFGNDMVKLEGWPATDGGQVMSYESLAFHDGKLYNLLTGFFEELELNGQSNGYKKVVEAGFRFSEDLKVSLDDSGNKDYFLSWRSSMGSMSLLNPDSLTATPLFVSEVTSRAPPQLYTDSAGNPHAVRVLDNDVVVDVNLSDKSVNQYVIDGISDKHWVIGNFDGDSITDLYSTVRNSDDSFTSNFFNLETGVEYSWSPVNFLNLPHNVADLNGDGIDEIIAINGVAIDLVGIPASGNPAPTAPKIIAKSAATEQPAINIIVQQHSSDTDLMGYNVNVSPVGGVYTTLSTVSTDIDSIYVQVSSEGAYHVILEAYDAAEQKTPSLPYLVNLGDVIRGDVDFNLKIDIFDLLGILGVLSGGQNATEASDVDSNGKTDIFDLLALLSILSG